MTLAMSMPPEKLFGWYEYGLLLQRYPIFTSAVEAKDKREAELQAELAAWEAASDEDWLKLEQQVQEAA